MPAQCGKKKKEWITAPSAIERRLDRSPQMASIVTSLPKRGYRRRGKPSSGAISVTPASSAALRNRVCHDLFGLRRAGPLVLMPRTSSSLVFDHDGLHFPGSRNDRDGVSQIVLALAVWHYRFFFDDFQRFAAIGTPITPGVAEVGVCHVSHGPWCVGRARGSPPAGRPRPAAVHSRWDRAARKKPEHGHLPLHLSAMHANRANVAARKSAGVFAECDEQIVGRRGRWPSRGREHRYVPCRGVHAEYTFCSIRTLLFDLVGKQAGGLARLTTAWSAGAGLRFGAAVLSTCASKRLASDRMQTPSAIEDRIRVPSPAARHDGSGLIWWSSCPYEAPILRRAPS